MLELPEQLQPNFWNLTVGLSVNYNASDTLSTTHEIKALVDPVKRQDMRNEIINIDLSIHVPVDDFWNVGATAGAAECSASPVAPCHELEWTGRDFLARTSYTDNYGSAPAAMTALQSFSHDIDIADTLKGIISSTIGEINQIRNKVFANFLRVDKVRRTELFRYFLSAVITVNTNDHICARHPCSLDNI